MPSSPPRLAVIIPSYNYEAYVDRAIASVTSQGCDECELVVVDDGSTDGSWARIQAHGLPNVLQVTNGGSAKACMAAADLTTAPHVLVLDSDDELKPGSLRRILSMLDPGVAKLQFALTPVGADGSVLGRPAPELGDFRSGLGLVRQISRTGCYTTPPTSGNVFRRDVFDVLREVDDVFVDGVTLVAAPFMGDVVSTSEQLGLYRIHGKGMSGLGTIADASKMRRDARRFEVQLAQLAGILDARGIPHDLPDARETLFHRERSLYACIADGRRPSVGAYLAMLRALWRHPMPTGRKAAVSALVTASMALSPSRSKAMLTYRLTPSGRSAAGMLRLVVSGRPDRGRT